MSVLGYHLLILIGLALRRPQYSWRPLGRKSLWIASALICLLAGPALYLLWPVIGKGDGRLLLWLSAHGLSGLSWMIFLPYFALVHPVLEELHWRGFTGGISQRIHWVDLAFAGYHVLVLYPLVQPAWLTLLFVILAASSAIWRHWSSMYRSVGLAVMTHTLADASVILATYFILKGLHD